MVIWPEFRMGQHRDDDHREYAPHFTIIRPFHEQKFKILLELSKRTVRVVMINSVNERSPKVILDFTTCTLVQECHSESQTGKMPFIDLNNLILTHRPWFEPLGPCPRIPDPEYISNSSQNSNLKLFRSTVVNTMSIKN